MELRLARRQARPGVVNCDPVRVRQILANLVGNAAKFTHAGVVEVRVHPYEKGLVRLTVSDSGIGLTEAQQAQLFNDFTQAEHSAHPQTAARASAFLFPASSRAC